MNINKKLSIFVLSVLSLTLSSCELFNFHSYISEYEIETELDIIERIRGWGIDLPDNTSLLHKKYGKYPGTDGHFDHVFYAFEVDNNFSFDATMLSSDGESVKKPIKNFYNLHEEITENRFNPEVNTSYVISVRLENMFEDNDFIHIYLENDKYYCRSEFVGDYMYAGKCYFALQENDHNTKCLYSFLEIDTHYVKYIRID